MSASYSAKFTTLLGSAALLLTLATSLTLATYAAETEGDTLEVPMTLDETDTSKPELPPEAFDNGLENPEIAESGVTTTTAETTPFNSRNRFLRWRLNNSLVFTVEDNLPATSQRILLQDSRSDMLGTKWSYLGGVIEGLNDYCLGLSTPKLSGVLQLSDCDALEVAWDFDEQGRLVGSLTGGGLGCVEGQNNMDLIELVLTTCNESELQKFQLEGTGVTADFASLQAEVSQTEEETENEAETVLEIEEDTTEEEPEIEESEAESEENFDPSSEEVTDSALAYIESRPEFSTFLTLIEESGLAEDFESLENATVLLPTNDAFARQDDETLAALRLPENRETLRTILTYQIVPERLSSEELLGTPQWRTVSGFNFFVSLVDGQLNGFAMLEETDIEVGNDVVLHTIDGVIFPNIEVPRLEADPDDTAGEDEDTSVEDDTDPEEVVDPEDEVEIDDLPQMGGGVVQNANAVTVLEEQGFNLLLGTVLEAELAEAVMTAENATILAPTDEAFMNLPTETINALLDPANRELLAEVLRYHLVDGALTSGDLASYSQSLPTLAEDAITDVSNLNLGTPTDLIADNNVIIHTLDEVLVPPSVAAALNDTASSTDGEDSGDTDTDVDTDPEAQYRMFVDFPTPEVAINGTQSFQFRMENLEPEEYQGYWQVNGGQLNLMEDTGNGKIAYVDVNPWNWNGTGPYTVTLSAAQNSNLLAQESVDILVP